MRTTLSIADDVLRDLQALARSRRRSLTDIVDEVLRAGLAAGGERRAGRRRYREQPAEMGMPQSDLSKALALAAELEDEETLRKHQLRD